MLENPCANAGDMGSIPARGAKIQHGTQRGQKIKISVKKKSKLKKHFLVVPPLKHVETALSPWHTSTMLCRP